MRRCLPVALVALLGATLALPAAAQWKWRDQGGRIQYSDLPPPPGVVEKDILQRPNGAQSRLTAPAAAAATASGASAPLLAASGVEPELEAKRKKAEQEKADKAKAEEQRIAGIRAQNCANARTQMRSLDSGMRMGRVNEKGEREILDDKGREAEANRARAVMATECK